MPIRNIMILIALLTPWFSHGNEICDKLGNSILTSKKQLAENKTDAALDTIAHDFAVLEFCPTTDVSNLLNDILKQAKSTNNSEVLLRLASVSGSSKRTAYFAFEAMTDAANLGNIEAQYSMGLAYKLGRVGLHWRVPLDGSKAAYWWQKASDSGDINATAYLADLYEEGDGVLQDYEKAFRLRRLAASKGQIDAMYGLGLMYAQSRGTKQDNIQAYVWLNLVAALEVKQNGFKNKVTMEERDKVAATLQPESVMAAQRIAKKCLESNFKDCN